MPCCCFASAGARVYDLSVTREFYARAAYAPLWTNALAVGELADSIEQAWREGMNPDDYHQRQVQGLRDGSLSLDVAARDLLLIDSLVRLIYHYALCKLKPASAMYQNLVSALARYRSFATHGDWIAVDEGPTLRVGIVDCG